MMYFIIFFINVVPSFASHINEDFVFKLDIGERYQTVFGPDGIPRLVDLWVRSRDVETAERFNPDAENVYHLFTRHNPSISQPMVLGNIDLIHNFNGNKKTIILVHGWMSDAASTINTVLVPAFLAAADVNVIVVDWSSGAGHINYATAVLNTAISGAGVARFISWFVNITGISLSQIHLVGHSLGGHQVGIIGRNLDGQVPYITSLDPAGPGWITNSNRFKSSDGIYTEVIHSNAGVMGYLQPLGQVDFYPNGGVNMPGCDSQMCDHNRALYYFGESLLTGGFSSNRCLTYLNALIGSCSLSETLKLGGLQPKTGQSGIYHTLTNPEPPFSQGYKLSNKKLIK